MTKENELDTTVDEWRAEMERIDSGASGMTMLELCREFGISRSTMQDRTDKLIKAGRCVKGTGRRIGVGGAYQVSVYQLKKEGK